MFVAPSEPPALRALRTNDTSPEPFGADVMFAAQGKLWGVQRKEWKDLLASVRDGRLNKELAQMQQLGVAILLVEGEPRWTRDGAIVHEYLQWSRKQWDGLLLSVQSRGVWLMHTKDLTGTIAFVLELHEWANKDSHASLYRRPKPANVWGERDNNDSQLWLLQAVDGIGPKQAQRIVEHFGRVPLQWSVTRDEMLQVKGIGKETVAKMWRLLDGPDDTRAREAAPDTESATGSIQAAS